jgi:protocatechuate 3,4-dioxygenase beta subunit
MTRIKRPFDFASVLIAALLAGPASLVFGQAPDSKPRATGSVSGRITTDEKPVPSILVIATNQNSQTQIGQAKTDSEGNYRIVGLRPGMISLTPVASVYVPPNPVFGQGRIVNLGANEAVEGIDFKLTRGGVITGRVTDARGLPVIEERISLTQVDGKGAAVPRANPVWANYAMYTTDDRGVYRLYGLSPGFYKVSVGRESGTFPGIVGTKYQRVFYSDATDIASATIVEVIAGGEAKNVNIKLGLPAMTYAVSGRVIDAENNQPLAGVRISLGTVQQSEGQSFVSSSFGLGAATNSQGEFRAEGITPGHYALIINPGSDASAPRVHAEPAPFEILDSDVTSLEIKAQRGLTISGVVVPEGVTDPNILAQLSKLMIRCNFNPGPTEIRRDVGGAVSQLNSDGSFSIDGVRPGKVSLEVLGSGAEGFTMTRIEHNGVVQGREIDLLPGTHISGFKVYVAFGASVVRGQIKIVGGALPNNVLIFVSLMRQGEGTRLNSQVDSRGHFVIKNVPVGNYEAVMILASPGSDLPRGLPRLQRQPIVVADGVDTEVVFTLDLTPKDGPQ